MERPKGLGSPRATFFFFVEGWVLGLRGPRGLRVGFLGFGFWGLGFRVLGLGLGFTVLGCRALGFRAEGCLYGFP